MKSHEPGLPSYQGHQLSRVTQKIQENLYSTTCCKVIWEQKASALVVGPTGRNLQCSPVQSWWASSLVTSV